MSPETSTGYGFSDLILGTDLVCVSRLEKTYRRFGEAFFARLLTDAELEYCRRDNKTRVFIQRAAARIAVKEAVSKALGTGLNGLGWSDGLPWKSIELLSAPNVAPQLKLHDAAEKAANKKLIRQWRISLSHDGDYAVATVIGLQALS